jgi:beta-glucanase (GH16 family)
VEEGRGIWPAYWFYGGNKNDEIDIFELKCEKNDKIHVDTHCPYGCDRGYKNKLGFKTNWGGWMPVSKYLHEGFNVMALEWKPNELIWYINGYPLAYFKGQFATPMNLYVNTSVAKDGEAFPPGPNASTKWPNTYSVDYFRAWNFVPAAEEIVLRQNPEMKLSDKYPSVYTTKPKKKNGINYHKKLKKEKGIVSVVYNGAEIIVTPLGPISDPKNELRLKGSKTDIQIKDFSKESRITLDPSETEVEVIIRSGKQQYSRKFKLARLGR